jgi:hypothetical protein
LKPRQRNLTPVLRRPVEPAANRRHYAVQQIRAYAAAKFRALVDGRRIKKEPRKGQPSGALSSSSETSVPAHGKTSTAYRCIVFTALFRSVARSFQAFDL